MATNNLSDYLDDYSSENGSENENENVDYRPRSTQSARKKNSKNKIYKLIQTFKGEREVKIDSFWLKRNTYPTADGMKQIFYCNKDKDNCKLSAYLLFSNLNENIYFYIEEGEHVHKDVRKKDVRDVIKEKVSLIMKDGTTKPSLVMRKLDEKYKINDVTKQQLTYLLGSLKEATYGQSTINLSMK